MYEYIAPVGEKAVKVVFVRVFHPVTRQMVNRDEGQMEATSPESKRAVCHIFMEYQNE